MNSNLTELGWTLADVTPGQGWHCSHFFYRFERKSLAELAQQHRLETAKSEFCEWLDSSLERPARFQLGIVAGHKADFSLMMMDPDPLRLEAVHQSILGSALGPAIETTWSYVSISEISEYALSVEEYQQRLELEGEDPGSESFQNKVARYRQRSQQMDYQRLTPDIPEWPVSCFYPMNKWRLPGANWYSLPQSERRRLMAEHARSGIQFAGKVSQLITVGVGLDDWEWGVTLWATNPRYLKEIVYQMRFDKASARYAEFGPFYTSYHARADQILDICQV